MLVLTKHSDPRIGETMYRLTGIVRAEPARSLFDLPPDYTLKESVIRRDSRKTERGAGSQYPRKATGSGLTRLAEG